jgi:hypothetical protein
MSVTTAYLSNLAIQSLAVIHSTLLILTPGFQTQSSLISSLTIAGQLLLSTHHESTCRNVRSTSAQKVF